MLNPVFFVANICACTRTHEHTVLRDIDYSSFTADYVYTIRQLLLRYSDAMRAFIIHYMYPIYYILSALEVTVSLWSKPLFYQWQYHDLPFLCQLFKSNVLMFNLLICSLNSERFNVFAKYSLSIFLNLKIRINRS